MRGPGWPSGTTRVAAVIGDPVSHSLSPAIHNAAFAAAGLDWVFVAFPVAEGGVPAALAATRSLPLEGLSVTTPHKAAVAALVDDLSPTAARLGAANVVVRRHDRLRGESTDGPGFLAALADEHGFDPAGRRCWVRGTGGAGRAVIVALAEAGAAEVVVVAGRDPARAGAAAALAGGPARVGRAAEAADADLVVNATSLGLGGRPGELAVDPALLTPGQLVVDIVYPGSRLVEAARARGAAAGDGVGMLVHQAALAFELWTGTEAPRAAMWGAARAALAPRPAKAD